MGQSIVHLLMLPCGERGAMVMTPPPMCAPAVSPCFHGFLAFLHRLFPPQSPPSQPFDPSLHSQEQPSPWDCSTIPKLWLPAAAPSGALCPWLWQGLSDSHPQIGCFNLSLRSFPSDSDSCPNVGMGLLLQFPNPRRAGPVLLTLLFSPLVPLSY